MVEVRGPRIEPRVVRKADGRWSTALCIARHEFIGAWVICLLVSRRLGHRSVTSDERGGQSFVSARGARNEGVLGRSQRMARPGLSFD